MFRSRHTGVACPHGHAFSGQSCTTQPLKQSKISQVPNTQAAATHVPPAPLSLFEAPVPTNLRSYSHVTTPPALPRSPCVPSRILSSSNHQHLHRIFTFMLRRSSTSMCNAPMRSHGDDTQQVVSNSDWTSRMRPMQNTSPWIRSSDHPIYARTRIWRACRSKTAGRFCWSLS